MITGSSMSDTLRTSNKQASKEQLKKMNKQLLVKFATDMSRAEMQERMGSLENQAEPGRLIKLHS